MRVLVTGASGFSGAEVTLELLSRGHHVTAVAGSTRGRLPEWVKKNDSIDIVSGNLAGKLLLPGAIDAVVHTAARSPAPGISVDDFVRDNVLATQKLVNHAVKSGVQTFIYLSSLSVYGQIDLPEVDEKTPMVNPDVYGLTKRLGEEILQAQSALPRSLAIRLPGVIGRRSVRNWLTSVLSAARAGKEITVFNEDVPFNNAIHVSELARFIGDLLTHSWRGFDAITVGAAGEISVGNAVRLLIRSCESSSHIRTTTSQKRSFLISSAYASKQYGYNPMDISEMLLRFAAENK